MSGRLITLPCGHWGFRSQVAIPLVKVTVTTCHSQISPIPLILNAPFCIVSKIGVKPPTKPWSLEILYRWCLILGGMDGLIPPLRPLRSLFLKALFDLIVTYRYKFESKAWFFWEEAILPQFEATGAVQNRYTDRVRQIYINTHKHTCIYIWLYMCVCATFRLSIMNFNTICVVRW